MKNKITLGHLAPYLPYKLQWHFESEEITHEVMGISIDMPNIRLISPYGYFGTCNIYSGRPVLRPLSDLTKEIAHSGEVFVPIDYINGEFAGKIPRKFEVNQTIRNPNIFFTLAEWISFKELHGLFELLFSWHFDVFGLIDKGLAIDKTKLKEETK